jgi:nucleoside triphosphate diphosphatase
MRSPDIKPLLDVMVKLRDPVKGCPWDVEQDFGTIAPYTIEETYEVADAIDRNDMNDLKDELGDLLLQVVFHSQIAQEAGHFDFGDVVASICDKMIRRHPHVFGNVAVVDAEAVKANWEDIKSSERHEQDKNTSALSGVARALPALLRAQKIQKRAARTGFDWPDVFGAKEKLNEEITELSEAKSEVERFEEMGDLLFAAVNVARHYSIDAEAALKTGTAKFEARFCHMEQSAGDAFENLSLSEKEALWLQAKDAKLL